MRDEAYAETFKIGLMLNPQTESSELRGRLSVKETQCFKLGNVLRGLISLYVREILGWTLGGELVDYCKVFSAIAFSNDHLEEAEAITRPSWQSRAGELLCWNPGVQQAGM